MFPPTVQKISSHYFFNSFIALFNVTKNFVDPVADEYMNKMMT